MATGRTHPKWISIYIDGIHLRELSTKSIGPLAEETDIADLTTLGDTVTGGLPNHSHVKIGTLNGVMDSMDQPWGVSLHNQLKVLGKRLVMIPIGIRAAAAQGDPVFNAEAHQLAYLHHDENGASVVTVPFSEWAGDGVSRLYSKGWGDLLHVMQAESAVNTASGVEDVTGGATSKGGYMNVHVNSITGGGDVTYKVQDSADNAIWADLAGATINIVAAVPPTASIVTIGTGATVRRFLRWQVVFNIATSSVFALAFVRGR